MYKWSLELRAFEFSCVSLVSTSMPITPNPPICSPALNQTHQKKMFQALYIYMQQDWPESKQNPYEPLLGVEMPWLWAPNGASLIASKRGMA